MRKRPTNLAAYYAYLAAGSASLGILITFITLYACNYFGVDISKNWWVLAIPVTLSAFLNVLFIEMWMRSRK